VFLFLAQTAIDTTWVNSLPDNLKSWGMIILLAILVAQKLFPQWFNPTPVVNPTPTPAPEPVPPVVVPPAPIIGVDHPLISQLLQLLIQFGPALLPLLLKAQAEEKAAKEKAAS
jgi:hypothetical protein